MTAREAVEAVTRGVLRAFPSPSSSNSDPGHSGGVIICALRSYSREHSLEMAELACELFQESKGVICGFDLAGDEGTYPLSLHKEAILYCKARSLPVTVHAGEWPDTTANLQLALQLGVDRIGHGAQSLITRITLDSPHVIFTHMITLITLITCVN